MFEPRKVVGGRNKDGSRVIWHVKGETKTANSDKKLDGLQRVEKYSFKGNKSDLQKFLAYEGRHKRDSEMRTKYIHETLFVDGKTKKTVVKKRWHDRRSEFYGGKDMPLRKLK